ncbi:response regulator transcription factor [Paraburkholderia sp. UCT31]|uniref:response regulator transcription factor n=1 Tax=Paraburkholderia sp. UCT31 TaxID=2615209 RepID=UPI001654FA2F|nr:response regulator transcription factor [Paraburkholderia sp. UCT31]MBC8740341.1 response regulator transcription factor [Paraburkholderia sp. UCT31]
MIPQRHPAANKSSPNMETSIVYVVDDDESVRRALVGLLRSVGLSVETFATSQEFLDHPKQDVPGCLILDVRLRGENGLQFQDAMASRNLRMPVVFVTGYGDIAMTVKAMKAGAQDFLAKPFRDQDMLDAVSHALAKDRERMLVEQSELSLRASYDSLTPRECEVVSFVLAGLLNKQIASEMNISEVTVKMHRGQAMRKMAARSVADLVRKVQTLGVEPGVKSETLRRSPV